jgi:hypothetical protein
MTAANGRRFLGRGSTDEVVCIACGETVPRSDAREYDKYGDRWIREGKRFEFLCKPCHRECCHQPRDGLEATLREAGAGETDRATFLGRYRDQVTEDATTK